MDNRRYFIQLCEKCRSLNSQKSNHLKEYNALHKRIRKNMKQSKENLLNNDCKDIEKNENEND